MSSIIEGYNYDIFISYRQKDNKGDRWVSEFVEALKTELESTFKEEISVYFDINPHDGLLETHDVDASLRDKLKCLVFIPIISRTYCDPKSFAWEHEFKAFVEQASQDQFGLKVTLHNGNVTDRVLPIQIHEIANDDKTHIEKELGGILRPIEFIYKEPGVNRALLSNEDHSNNNLNKTFYRNQINKVANAIDEILTSLKNIPAESRNGKPKPGEQLTDVSMEERFDRKVRPAKLPKRKPLIGSIVLAILLVIAALFVYPNMFKRNILEKLRSSGERISVAVMPFQNMTNDTTWNIWQDGIQNELINNLTNSEELKVRQTESIAGLLQSKGLTNYASITPSIASNISQKLDANVFIYGSIKEVGKTIRINAQLIDAKTNESFKSFQIDDIAENILHITDSLSRMVKNYILISTLEKELPVGYKYISTTNSPEAFRYFIYGQNAFFKDDFQTASKMFSQALSVDSNFTSAKFSLSCAYINQSINEGLSFMNRGLLNNARKLCVKLYEKKDQMPMEMKIRTNLLYAVLFETPNEEIQYLMQLLELDDQSPNNYFNLGISYAVLYQYDKAIPEFEKALEILNKWGSKPPWVDSYIALGYAYHKTNQYEKERSLYRKAENDFPDNPDLISIQAILSFSEKDTIRANKYIEKFLSVLKGYSTPDSLITLRLARIYSEGGILNKAEQSFRKALSLQPKNPAIMNNLAYFLIDKESKINEGLELVGTALELSPNNWDILDTKGWGLYKQGKYKEALDIFQKSWDLRMKNAIYDQEAFLHLEAAKKAFAGQK